MISVVSTAHAAGIPIAGSFIDSATQTTIGFVGKFDQDQFTAEEVEGLAQTISAALALLGDSAQGVTLYTPSQLSGMGFSDADALKTFARSERQAMGVDTLLFLDATKKPSISEAYGKNIRIDVFVADMASTFALPGQDLYVASVETPELFTTMFSSLF